MFPKFEPEEVKIKLSEELFAQLKAQLPELEKLVEETDRHWGGEDSFYRFYHQSFKVYGIQAETQKLVEALRKLMPERELNPDFLRIINEGTGKQFTFEHNRRWHEETRPMLEAFFHAQMMAKMAVKYAKKLDAPPQFMPSGWAAFLYLYNLR